MPFELDPPPPWKARGWKVKISEKERLEPPHVTVKNRTRVWRIGLRDGEPLDTLPPLSDVPEEILEFIFQKENWELLQREWDEMYPENPIASTEDEDE
jgi:hypothetical protein